MYTGSPNRISVVQQPVPSVPNDDYCKQSKTGRWDGLGMRQLMFCIFSMDAHSSECFRL